MFSNVIAFAVVLLAVVVHRYDVLLFDVLCVCVGFFYLNVTQFS